MLSIDEFKQTLPIDHSLTEEEIKELKANMEAMAEIFFEMWIKEKQYKKLN